MNKKHSITIRINSEEKEMIEYIKKILGNDTITYAIMYCIKYIYDTLNKNTTRTTVFPYVGKKHGDIARSIANLYNASGCTTFVDLFCGSLGSIEYLPIGTNIIANDKYKPLTNFYLVLQNNFGTFCDKIRSLPHSDTLWKYFNAMIEKSLNTFSLKGDIDLAVAFYYTQFYSFRGNPRNQTFSMSFKEKTKKINDDEQREKLLVFRKNLADITILNRDYKDIIKQASGKSNVFIYADPPYIESADKYHNSKNFDHAELVKLLKKSGCFYAISDKVGNQSRKLYRSNCHLSKRFNISRGEPELLVTNVNNKLVLESAWKKFI